MSICTAPAYQLRELNNLFIELTAKNCNQRCSGCYIDFPISKQVKDFISIDSIKEAINDTRDENIQCIYLTGGEPMMHPDFNTILRLCLKRSNVCVCTNASFLNEKKIRFLKKVEDEGLFQKGSTDDDGKEQNQIFFRFSVAHYLEQESDKVKYRGHFRQTLSALKILSRYNFTSVLSVQNFYKLSEAVIKESIRNLLAQNEIRNTDIQVNVSYPDSYEQIVTKSEKTDCMYGRVLSKNGVYSCPFLSNDYRGRMGSSFKNFSTSITAETDFCSACSLNNKFMFAIG